MIPPPDTRTISVYGWGHSDRGRGWHWSTLIDFGQSSQSRYCTQVAAATAVAGVVASC